MNSNKLTAAALVCGITLSAGAFAQMDMQFAPVDLYACTLDDHTDWHDVARLDESFAAWAAENDPAQSAWRIVPQWRSGEGEFDVGYIGAWQNGAQMGAGIAAWMAGAGREVAMHYGEHMDCAHALMASLTLQEPEMQPPGDGVVWFNQCTLAEGATIADAAAAHRAYADGMDGKVDTSGGSWIFLPTLGTGDPDFDYYHVAAWDGYESLGNAFETYFNAGGWKVMAEAMTGVANCSSPNLYDVTAMRRAGAE